MKKLFAVCVFAMFLSGIHAQNIIDKHYQHFVDADESTVVHVAGLTFQMASNVLGEELEEEKEFIQSIQSFDLVAMPTIDNPREEYKAAVALIGSDYEELINVKEKDGNFSLHIDEENGTVYEVVGIAGGSDEFVIFSLLGQMDLDQIGDMISKIDDQNFGALKDVNLSKVEEVKVYPNPVNTANQFTIDIPDEMIGGKLIVVDPSGAQVKSIKINGNKENIKTNDMNPGYYVVTIENAGVTIKKKVLVVR